jgi:hypothetical protein
MGHPTLSLLTHETFFGGRMRAFSKALVEAEKHKEREKYHIEQTCHSQ